MNCAINYLKAPYAQVQFLQQFQPISEFDKDIYSWKFVVINKMAQAGVFQ